jgi:predicted GNAT family N-acyltransferase
MEIITYHSSEYHEMLALRYKILREPWGLSFSEEDLQREEDDIFIACRENGCITGCCILTRISDEVVKLRQMAVDIPYQGKNVGRKIMAFAEQYAVEHGYSKVKLHARKTASGFYAKCGYAVSGEEFLEIGIPHFLMEKYLKSCKK